MASVTRYRQQLSQVETQNKELQNDLHFLEQQRLAQWQAMRVCVCVWCCMHCLCVTGWVGMTGWGGGGGRCIYNAVCNCCCRNDRLHCIAIGAAEDFE